MIALDGMREAPPRTRSHLYDWIWNYTGVRLAWRPVCHGHSTPLDMLWEVYSRRPPIILWHGPRGGGKSFLAGLDVHLASRFNPLHGSTILGGSAQQSKQIYMTLRKVVKDGRGPAGGDGDTIARLLDREARYHNGSSVSLLAASETSVRGPHVPTLKLDEVDEIPESIRESAIGMAMEQNGVRASIHMMSTWHRLDGPMKTLKDMSNAGAFPSRTFCTFDILETCPAERSGPWVAGRDAYLNCPACPIRQWCHADRHRYGGLPRAKRGNGHYSIDALIAKTKVVSAARLEADYFCGEPKPHGSWFANWSTANVSNLAEYDPALPVWVLIDTGVRTGAVWLQILDAVRPQVRVFADYFAEGLSARENAAAIIEVCNQRCGGRRDVVLTDPAGGARNPVGPIVINEYKLAGLKNITGWPVRPVLDGLELVSTFVRSADGYVGLLVHERCVHLRNAFTYYSRKKVRGQYLDVPADEQHPHEDVMDPLRCGLVKRWPRGLEAAPKGIVMVPGNRIF